MIFLVVFLMVVPVLARGQNLIPPIQTRWADLKLWGFTQVCFDSSVAPKVQWKLGRLYLETKTPVIGSSPVIIFIQAQPLLEGELSSNWLKQAWAKYTLGGWSLKGPLIFVAGGYTTPGQHQLETVEYPRVPGKFYGYGIQVQKDIWRFGILADITGTTDKVFYKKESLESVEFSNRVSYSLFSGDSFTSTLAGTTQLAEGYNLFVVDTENKTSRFTAKGAAYALMQEGTDEETGESLPDKKGFYVFLGFKFLSWVEVHSQADYQVITPEKRDRKSDIIWTNGIRLWTRNDNLALTVDYVSDHHRVLGRVQFRF